VQRAWQRRRQGGHLRPGARSSSAVTSPRDGAHHGQRRRLGEHAQQDAAAHAVARPAHVAPDEQRRGADHERAEAAGPRGPSRATNGDLSHTSAPLRTPAPAEVAEQARASVS
jgi:hypothetical protein